MSEEPAPNRLDDQGRKTGLWAEPDSHGGVITGEYVEGERQGEWRHYFIDGSLRSAGTYDRGALHGAWTWYRATGGLLQRGGFLENEKHGRWERWKADGEPLDTAEWDRGKKLRTLS
jgi:antitoxin component YwqK of YwqJK toxin-antitoxin module